MFSIHPYPCPYVQMLSVVLAALLGLASARPQLPAGVSAASCPNYPFCGAAAPADFPTPVVNGETIVRWELVMRRFHNHN